MVELLRSPAPLSFDTLSARELQVIEMAAAGLLDKEICAEIGFTHNTLRTYWARIRHKLGSATRTGLVVAFLNYIQGSTDSSTAAIPHDSWEVDLATDLLYGSDNINDLHGFERGVPHHKSKYAAHFHPEDAPMVRCQIDHAVHGTAQFVHLTFRIIIPAGVHLAHIFMRIGRDETGKAVRLYGQRVQTLDCRPGRNCDVKMGFWVRDLLTDQFEADADCCAIFKLPVSARTDRNQFYSRIHADDRAHSMNLVTSAVAQSVTKTEQNYRLQQPDGSTSWLRTVAVIEYVDGVATRATGTVLAFD